MPCHSQNLNPSKAAASSVDPPELQTRPPQTNASQTSSVPDVTRIQVPNCCADYSSRSPLYRDSLADYHVVCSSIVLPPCCWNFGAPNLLISLFEDPASISGANRRCSNYCYRRRRHGFGRDEWVVGGYGLARHGRPTHCHRQRCPRYIRRRAVPRLERPRCWPECVDTCPAIRHSLGS